MLVPPRQPFRHCLKNVFIGTTLSLSFLAALAKPANCETFKSDLTLNDYLRLDKPSQQTLIDKYVSEGNSPKASSHHYRTLGNTTREELLKCMLVLEEQRRLFKTIFSKPFKSRNQCPAYILKDRKSYNDHIYDFFDGDVSAGWSAGMFMQEGFKKAIFLYRPIGANYTNSILRHEATHHLLCAYIKGLPPIWFNEGLAINMETWKTGTSLDDNLRSMIQRNRWCKQLATIYPDKGFRSFADIQKITDLSWRTSKSPHLNFASVWASVHYLLTTHEGNKTLQKIMKKLRAGSKSKKVLSQFEIKTINKKVDHHVKNHLVPYGQHGFYIKHLIAKKLWGQARERTNQFLSSYPEHPHANLYDLILKVHNEKVATEDTNTLLGFEKRKTLPKHYHLVLAKAFYQLNDSKKAAKYHAIATGTTPNHPDVIELQNLINDQSQ